MSIEAESDETDALDWIASNRERVESLAASDRETADAARAVLDHLDESEGFDSWIHRPSTPLTAGAAERRAREVRATLAAENGSGGDGS
jgi:hypothetical protein